MNGKHGFMYVMTFGCSTRKNRGVGYTTEKDLVKFGGDLIKLHADGRECVKIAIAEMPEEYDFDKAFNRWHEVMPYAESLLTHYSASDEFFSVMPISDFDEFYDEGMEYLMDAA